MPLMKSKSASFFPVCKQSIYGKSQAVNYFFTFFVTAKHSLSTKIAPERAKKTHFSTAKLIRRRLSKNESESES